MFTIAPSYAPSQARTTQNYFDYCAERYASVATRDREPEALQFSLYETYEVADIYYAAR